MPFANRCSFEFKSDVKTRGEQYYREDRVQLATVASHRVAAVVSGGSGDYEVVVDWSENERSYVEASCTCPYFDDHGLCKHIWATMLDADAKGIGPRRGSGQLTVFEADSDEDDDQDDDWEPEYDLLDEPDDDDQDDDDQDDDDQDDDEGPGWSHRSGGRDARRSSWQGMAQGRRSPRPTGWRQQLAEVFREGASADPGRGILPVLGKSRQAWYVLDVSSSLADGALAIQFFQRETKQSGQFGTLKSLNCRQDTLDQFPSQEDRELLRGLLAADSERDDASDPYPSRGRYGYYGYSYQPRVSEVSVSPAGREPLLAKLCATGRFAWVLDTSQQDPEEDGHTLAWDDGPAWRFQLNVEADDEHRRWRLTGSLVREGENATIPVTAPVLLMAGGLIVFEDRMARLDAGGVFPWLVALRRNATIEVPYEDRWDLLERLWRSPSQVHTSLPANLGCEEVRLAPQGHLTIHSSERYGPRRFPADVHFLYDDKRVTVRDRGASILDAEKERILARDREQENRLLAQLAEQGARADDAGDHDVWIPQPRFSDLVAALVEAGWIVEAEGQRLRKAGQWRLSVTSGIDWFDLEGTCDFDGQAVRLPDLLEALRRGEGFVRLGDGSRGLLPQEWLARFAPLVEMGTAQDEHIRFRPSQALLLDALLAAHKEVSVDRQFAHIRRRLKSFDGVSPRNEPRGFQGELRGYQKEGLGWLGFLRDFRLGGCLADDMGLGKTIQVLAQIQSRRLRPKNGGGARAPSLVVVPRSLVFNWIEEARRFTPNLRVLDYTGTLRAGALERLDQVDLIVTTYGTLCRDIAQFKDLRFDYVILDEAQAIKNAHSQRAKACRLLQADHRLAVTGTPVENHLGELWSLFEFLNPGMLGRSATFQRLSKGTTGGDGDLAVLRRALAPFLLRRTKVQVLRDLPEKTEQTLCCELTGSQRKHYNQLRDFYRASLSKRIADTGLAKAKIHVLEALLRLRQVACHPGLVDKDRVGESSVKLDMLVEQLGEVIDAGHKALVFSQCTSFLAIVRARLDAEKITYEYLDGQTRDRQARVERFQNDPACPLFLISLKAGGHGLNLTAADYVFLLDPWWNPAVEAQAVDRTHRIGQTRRVFAYRIIARDTVEEKVLELQKTKRDLAEAIISADDNVLRQLTADDLQMLLS